MINYRSKRQSFKRLRFKRLLNRITPSGGLLNFNLNVARLGMVAMSALIYSTESSAESVIATLTTAAHPVKFDVDKNSAPQLTSLSKAEALFDAGSVLLSGQLQSDEDVIDVKFKLVDIEGSTQSVFPDQSNDPDITQQYNYTLEKYNYITNDITGRQLLNATFAQVKLVKSAWGFTGEYSGWANHENRSMILTDSALDSTTVHEFGHFACLPHSNLANRIMFRRDTNKRKSITDEEAKYFVLLAREMEEDQ